MPDHKNGETGAPGQEKAGDERGASTLLPMLVAGLVLIVVGAIVVMTFV